MLKVLYFVEKEFENGELDEPFLLTKDQLMEIAREYDEDIDEEVLIDALTNTFGYTITEVKTLEDFSEVFIRLKEDYMNF